MIKAKPKKCKICKSEYQPYSSLSKACSGDMYFYFNCSDGVRDEH